MQVLGPVIAAASSFFLPLFAYFFWRYVWFFRNPDRQPPKGEQIISPADGTVVYVKHVSPMEPVISIKKKNRICVSDIVRKDLKGMKLLVGIFMSPFDVHYNRAPISGRIESIRHHPAKLKNHHMGSMHWRSVLRLFPIYQNSLHIVDNERTVTKIKGTFEGETISCYVVQIAGGSVRGIESYVSEGEMVERGGVFGMIRIGSQVDLIVSFAESMHVKVKPGDKTRAGETVLIA